MKARPVKITLPSSLLTAFSPQSGQYPQVINATIKKLSLQRGVKR